MSARDRSRSRDDSASTLAVLAISEASDDVDRIVNPPPCRFELTGDQEAFLRLFSKLDMSEWRFELIQPHWNPDYYYVGARGRDPLRIKNLLKDRYFYWPNHVFNDSTDWVEPSLNSPILVVERKWAEKIVNGIKTVELRNNTLRRLKQGDTVYIAAKASKHQGRRAYPSPLPEHEPKKGEILGSVRFSYQDTINSDEFDSLFTEHQVEYREDAPAGDKEGRLHCWFFYCAIKLSQPRQYIIEQGSQSWRKFRGWI